MNLDEKINIIFDFKNNSLNNYDIKSIDYNKVKIDDIQINKPSTELLTEFLNAKFQHLFDTKYSSFYARHGDLHKCLVKISYNSSKQENDNLISYILSEIALKKNINILLPIVNFKVKTADINTIITSEKESCFVQIREFFDDEVYLLKDCLDKVDTNQIEDILKEIKNKYPNFRHNRLNPEDILVFVTDNKYTIKLCNFEDAELDSKNDDNEIKKYKINNFNNNIRNMKDLESFNGKRDIKPSQITIKSKHNSLGNQRHLNGLVGGGDKTTKPPFKTEKNTPFLSNDERNTFKKKQAELPPKQEPTVLLEQKLYDVRQTPPAKPPPPPAFIPIYNYEGGDATGVLPVASIQNPAYQGTVQKIYNVSIANPMGNYTTINRIYEDVLPGDPRTLSFTSSYERDQLINFVRNIILDTIDGEDMNIVGGKNSFLSYIKLIDLNPYSLSKNPYDDLGDNFMLYRSAYPIRYNQEKSNIEIAKNALGINVRIYNMTIGDRDIDKLKEYNLDEENFDLWREIRYYNYIKDLLKKKISPNFINSILYKIDSKSNIDWIVYNEIKSKGKEVTNKANKLLNDFHNMTQYKYLNVLNKPLVEVYCFCEPNHIFIKNEWNTLINSNLQNVKFFFIDINDTELVRKYIRSGHVTNHPLIIYRFDTQFQKHKNEKTCISILQHIENLQNTTKVDITLPSSKSLVLLTEAPNNNIISWMSPIYEGQGTVKKMISTGFHTKEVWFTVLFQLIYTMAVLQENDIYYEEISLEDNFFIKDLFAEQLGTNYWIYQIDNFKYYIPNYGYLVTFDSKYKNIKNDKPKELVYKVSSKKLFTKNSNKYETLENFSDLIYKQCISLLDPINFSSKLKHMGGLEAPPEVLEKLREINAGVVSKKIRDIIKNHFKKFLHNKMGTLLSKTEKEIFNILSRPELKSGNLVVYQKRYDEYEWVIYKGPNGPRHTIIRENGNEEDVYSYSLMGYPEINKIQPNNTEQVNYDENHLIEKYSLDN